MRKWTLLLSLVLTLGIVADSSARRIYITPEQHAQLQKIEIIYLRVLALTEDGRVPTDDLVLVIQPRLETLGYNVVSDRTQPHDVQLKVKCEERKKWSGTTRAGGDAELADSPARLWKGPACLFSYLLQGKDLGWYKEVRTPFEDPTQAAQSAQANDPGAYALSQLQIRLQEFDFPIMVAAEWGQIHRILHFLGEPDASKTRKLRILDVLTKQKSQESLPYLKELIKDKDYAEKAIVAMAGLGSATIPDLVDLLKNGQNSQVKAAAAKGLGIVAATTGDPATNPPLLDYLQTSLNHMHSSEDIDFPVLTEVVWSMTKLRNDKYIKPIEDLNVKIWLIRDNSPEMQKLRDAANVATKMVDLDYQIM
jgi:hypothetical protein